MFDDATVEVCDDSEGVTEVEETIGTAIVVAVAAFAAGVDVEAFVENEDVEDVSECVAPDVSFPADAFTVLEIMVAAVADAVADIVVEFVIFADAPTNVSTNVSFVVPFSCVTFDSRPKISVAFSKCSIKVIVSFSPALIFCG